MSQFDQLPDILTPAQVAEYLHISHDAVRSLLRAGKLRGVNAGARKSNYWRIPKDNLLEFLQTPAPVSGAKRPKKSSVVKTYF